MYEGDFGMKKVIEYMNWSTDIFEGFYESILFNSGTLDNNPYVYDAKLPEGYCWDIADFRGYMNAVGDEAVNLIASELANDSVVLDMKFTGISSPREYNFTTDKLCADVTVDYEKLKDYCLNENRTAFDEYLRENFSDRDGFWSFVANNVKDFESELESESEKYDNVMLEYYLLNLEYMKTGMDFSSYQYDLMEKLDEILSEFICLEKDGKYYSYGYADDGDTVVVGKELGVDN